MTTKAVTVKAETAPVVTEQDAILSMIERAARDPAVDIDKMERLFAMRERMLAQTAKTAYLAALSAAQPELPVVDKKGFISTNEKNDQGQKTGKQKKQSAYAKWEDVVEEITPVISRHGFSLTFRIAQPTTERVVVTAVLGHAAGHSEETAMGLPLDSSGSKNNVQGWGSSVSYGKRYTAFALLNIVAREEDDDGQAGGAGEVISEAQLDELTKLITDTNSDIPKFCRNFEITAINLMPVRRFAEAKTALLNKKAALAKGGK